MQVEIEYCKKPTKHMWHYI